MKEYVKVLEEYAQQHVTSDSCTHAATVLGRLYCCYHETNYVDTESVRARFAAMDSILDRLDMEQADQVIYEACGLCNIIQKNAFQEGVLVGVKLYRELVG